MTFDPDAAAAPGSGIFGLSTTREQAKIVLIPVPFDATTSYGRGTADGPAAIFDASMQVDLYDLRFGRVYEQGIFMEKTRKKIRQLSEEAGKAARPIIRAGGATKNDKRALTAIGKACERVAELVRESVAAVLAEGRVPGVIGGEHAVSYGAIQACAEKHGDIGILQIDAHMDLREAFEGFAWSHASIMHNVMSRISSVSKLVQVGIRDFGEGELRFAKSCEPRIVTHFDDHWAERLAEGTKLSELCQMAIEPLPGKVYVSFDIDGLNPALCPHTGTPVPGGLSFQHAGILLDMLKKSGRKVIGFDLVEVAPGKDEWDANVGARLLYKMCGLV